jgi:hypothetical protein
VLGKEQLAIRERSDNGMDEGRKTGSAVRMAKSSRLVQYCHGIVVLSSQVMTDRMIRNVGKAGRGLASEPKVSWKARPRWSKESRYLP